MASYYGINDYEKDPLGGYTFRKEDGSTLYASGDEAEKLAQDLEKKRYEEALAMSGESSEAADKLAREVGDKRFQEATASLSPYGAGMTPRQGPPAYPSGPPGPNASIDEQIKYAISHPVKGKPPRPAPATAEPARPAAPQAPMSPMTPSREQQMARAINAPVYMPGTPGRDPEREKRTGVYVQTGKTTSREGMGEPLSQEMLDQREELQARTDAATMARMREEQSASTLNAIRMDIEARDAQEKVEERKRIRDEAGRRVASAWENVNQTEAEARAGKVDPTKFFSDRGTWATIGAAIASGLGAYGASLGGGQNHAQQIIEAAISRDIAAQKEEINTKRESARNALAMRNDAVGDLDVAEKILKEEMLRMADVEREAFAAASGAAIAPAQMQEWEAARMEARADAEQKFVDERIGREVENVSYEFAQPRAARGGGMRAPTLSEQAKRAKALGEIYDVEQKVSGGNEEPVDEAALERYAERKADEAAQIEAAKQQAAVMKVTLNPDGTMTEPEDWEGVSGHGITGHVPDLATLPEGMAFRQAANSALSGLLKLQSGGQVTEEEFNRKKGEYLGSTDNDAKRGLRNEWAKAVARMRERDASVSDAVLREYKRRQARGTIERGAMTGLAKNRRER